MTQKHRPGTGQEMSTFYSRRTRFDTYPTRSYVTSNLIAEAMDEYYEDEDWYWDEEDECYDAG